MPAQDWSRPIFLEETGFAEPSLETPDFHVDADGYDDDYDSDCDGDDDENGDDRGSRDAI